MENEKDILEMVVMEIETWTRSCTRKADKYQKDMDEDYVHFSAGIRRTCTRCS